eukprot:comp6252_c0_seq1/m.2073 comp6252_c0_seq1/g.2073  ORF comp6252_c0_seq1/g.2073 comp6252_c0_seq1/m.2073 type:complete len:429 (-) comp6252_c0_seq1:64-1350(-)
MTREALKLQPEAMNTQGKNRWPIAKILFVGACLLLCPGWCTCVPNTGATSRSLSKIRALDPVSAPHRLSRVGGTDDCPCENKDWCRPIQAVREREVYGFTSGTDDDWKHFDWDTVTTIAWANPNNSALMCYAHSKGVRVIAATPPGLPLTGDRGKRAEWIKSVVSLVQTHHMDGVTFDYEEPIAADAPERDYYTALVKEATEALHSAVPGSQVSVCAAWAPDNIDGRAYDYHSLAAVSDLLYVMVYDTRSQVFDRCLAGANAPLSLTQRGLARYMDIGVPKDKIILGVPWYGYTYPCVNMSSPQDIYCPIPFVPFRGVDCSDAAGAELDLRVILRKLEEGKNTTAVMWDDSVKAPYFNYVHEDGTIHQMWFDNAASLSLKYKLAHDMGIRGAGPFTYDDAVAKVDGPLQRTELPAMWKALADYARHYK